MNSIFKPIMRLNTDVIGIPVPASPTRLSSLRKSWAANALAEELAEFVEATELEEEIDALADLVVFALGRFVETGVDPYPVFELISEKNRQKMRGNLAKRPGSLGYDLIKPEGWTPPAHKLKPLLQDVEPLKLVILSHGGHGKDTVAEMFGNIYGLRYTNASLLLAGIVNETKFHGTYASPEECYNDRSNNRPAWSNALADYTRGDPGKIARMVFEQSDVYCGIRRREELAAVEAEHAPVIIWVDALDRLPAENNARMDVEPRMADFVIDNNGALDRLEKHVCFIGDMLYK